ncbi:MAG TPA: PspC domain-containing protein [Chloroflexota bacterium]
METEPWRRRRLTRSSRERMWAGVAGGLAEYFDVDATLMRLMWLVATVVTGGLFVAVYFVMWVIMPLDSDLPATGFSEAATPTSAPGSVAADAAGWEQPSGEPTGWGRHDYWYDYSYHHHARRKRSAGIVLIVLGLLFLSSQIGLFRWINWGVAWAVVLIVLGMALLMRHHDWRL